MLCGRDGERITFVSVTLFVRGPHLALVVLENFEVRRRIGQIADPTSSSSQGCGVDGNHHMRSGREGCHAAR